MSDCHTTRVRLDILSTQALSRQEGDAELEVSEHLASCAECQRYAEQLREFDARVTALLLDVPLPGGLQDRLLAAIEEATVCEEPAQRRSESRSVNRSNFSRRRLGRLVMAGMLAVVVVAISMIWTQPESPSTFNYAEAKSQLRDTFSQMDDQEWESLSSFDRQSFQVDRLDSALRQWDLSEVPVGINLDEKGSHDVAAYRFAYQQWSGILVVLPTELFHGAPAQISPRAASGRSVLEWQSPDGTLTYLCFVKDGAADQLAEAMFSIG